MIEIAITALYRFFKRAYTALGLWHLGIDKLLVFCIIEPIIMILSWSKQMTLFTHENWGTRLRYLLGWYEYGSVVVSQKLLKPGMIALDIGADVGYYARLFSSLVGKHGKVFAFEPHPKSFALLKRNASPRRFSNVICVNDALSDHKDSLTFYTMDTPGKHSLFNVDASHTKESIKVEALTLDEFLKTHGNPRIDFLKMDIEGAEPSALRGMTQMQKRSRNLAMLIEFNARALRAGGTTPKQFLHNIEQQGFKVFAITEATGALKEVDEEIFRYIETGYVNLLCVKGLFIKKLPLLGL